MQDSKEKQEQKKWLEKIAEMEKTNRELKAKTPNFFPVLKCCDCERELSDAVALLNFGVYYFCEACIQKMIDQLNREEKEFIQIGQEQVKRYQLREAISELAKEREELGLQTEGDYNNQSQSQARKRNNKSITSKESKELIAKHMNNTDKEKTQRRWEDLKKVCVRCSDNKCFQEELCLFTEVKTGNQIAICLNCLNFLHEQIKFTYKNIFLHKTLEISNQQIKTTYKEFLMNHIEMIKHTCIKCLLIRLNTFVVSKPTSQKETKIICQQCFTEIFQHDDKLEQLGISDLLRDQILDIIFQEDFEKKMCISCNKTNVKTLVIENISTYPLKKKIGNVKFRSNFKYAALMSDKAPPIQNELTKANSKTELNENGSRKDIASSKHIGGVEELIEKKLDKKKLEQPIEKVEETAAYNRSSHICYDCIFLNIGKCKNPYLDYLITYMNLHTNMVFKYNKQIKEMLDSDTRMKIEQNLNTCVLCLRKSQDLHDMNSDQKICTTCFVQYRKQFEQNQGEYDGFYCDPDYQEIIFRRILAHTVDLTLCLGCCEKVKGQKYELVKVQNSFSNAILCNNCIEEQLSELTQDLRKPYEIKSVYLNNDIIAFQNKKEVNTKIAAFIDEKKMKQAIAAAAAAAAEKQEEGEAKQAGKRDHGGIPPNLRQHFTSKNYNTRCFNKHCREVEIAQKNKVEIHFVKMPKCQCIFCLHCLTNFYFKLAEANIKQFSKLQKQATLKTKIKQVVSGDEYIQSIIDKGEEVSDDKRDEIQKFCPSMLCTAKYSEYQIKELSQGYQLDMGKEEEEAEFKKNQIEFEHEEARRLNQNVRVSCSICRKENLLLVVMNDDYLIQRRLERQKQSADYQMMQTYFKDQEELFSDLAGYCECQYSCKPCMFSLFYKDECFRCQKKPAPHVYRLLFHFKENMKCSVCSGEKFVLNEEGPLLYRTNNHYQCTNCKMRFNLN